MGSYQLDENQRFIINGYQGQRPFSSTLPGIAGSMGIPIWAFYVNRGQAMASFGVENKDHPILEFQPANKAYQVTPFLGFRTFIKILRAGEPHIYEPFAAGTQDRDQKMIISLSELELQERDPGLGLAVEVLYFVLPEEGVAGLVRQVKITNLADQPANLEILDGLPAIIPYGVTNLELKEIHRTIEAWMDVYNVENCMPFFRLRSSPGDTAEVKPVQAGNFAFACAARQDGEYQKLLPIIDPGIVFGQDTSFSFPDHFSQHALLDLLWRPQIGCSKTPCAFFGLPVSLAASESLILSSLYGHASKVEVVNRLAPRFGGADYFVEKRKAAKTLVDAITKPIATHTSMPMFDAYCRQTFLDNVLRGGLPVQLGQTDKPIFYYIYSRKHGDPERDYNAFYLAPEYFSQGNGNFRDVNQNRRSDIFFSPRLGDTNVRAFMSLIQADGYNPLVIQGSRFRIPPKKWERVLSCVLQPEGLEPFLDKPFTPGGLLKWIDDQEIHLQIPPLDFLNLVLASAEQSFEAEFGEGFWADHWFYNLDLIDSFLVIYPDRAEELLFGKEDLTFFESPVFVQPRSKKYVLVRDQPHQYHALVHDTEKAALIASRKESPSITRSQKGRGPIVRTSIYGKLVLLALIKFATMDPYGMGIEMEAGKPGWCDALNGLPGLFGSSMSETFELRRLLDFLLQQIPDPLARSLRLPVEIVELLQSVVEILQNDQTIGPEQRNFLYWDQVATAREIYREKTRLGFGGKMVSVSFYELKKYLTLFLKKVQEGIDRAVLVNGGAAPTYFTYEVEAYEILQSPEGTTLVDEENRPYIRPLRFQQKGLPLFLEGAVHMFNTLPGLAEARKLHRRIKNSALYDPALKMYKTNAPLEGQSLEIGRLRAFTPGWLENESIFLHMEYKYLLELLRAGLYEEFFEDFQNVLIAFQDPARYGRSPLENSSFLVSSAHPDKSLHGAGFVARLTGATAEFLSMWNLMMVGPRPFFQEDGQLCLRFQPALPGRLFDESGQLRFTFLGSCQVTYFNPARMDTYSPQAQIQSLTLHLNGERVIVEGNVLKAPYASLAREGRIDRIEVYFRE